MRFFDLHCDTAFECSKGDNNIPLDRGAYHISLERGNYFDAWHQVFAIFMPDELRGEAAVRHYQHVRDYIYRQCELFPDRFVLCRTAEELNAAESNGLCGAIMSVEGGSAAAGSLDNIRRMYDDGVRLMTLTWNAANEIAQGVMDPVKGGLTAFGKEVVALMNELDMIVDVSHLSDEGFADVAALSRKPFVASHSCSRRLCGHPRNLTDDMFQTICRAGGLVGINFSRGFLVEDSNTAMTDVIRHTEHFLSLEGENTVCMGSDFDGTDMPDGITGVESIGSLYELFLKHNYSESLVRKIFWDNAHGFVRKALAHQF